MAKRSKFFICKCVKKICPMKFHVIQDPELRSMVSNELLNGIRIHVNNNKSVVFIEET